MRLPARFPAAAALLSALALAGCGLGAGDQAEGPRLLVTDGFGARVLHDLSSPDVGGSDTVMRLLQRNAKVATRYGGGFVQSIEGRSGGTPGGRPVDWFYYVNGVLADEGGAATRVRDGDAIWWDRHDWGAGETKAVVGSFPAPFVRGTGDAVPAVRVECAAATSAACATAVSRLKDVGVEATRTRVGAPRRRGALRMLVGTYAELRGDAAVRALERGPRVSGVYARFTADGRTLTAVSASGRSTGPFPAGTGLVAATVREGRTPVWILTGTTAAAVAIAARALDQASLKDRFALAVLPPDEGSRRGLVAVPSR